MNIRYSKFLPTLLLAALALVWLQPQKLFSQGATIASGLGGSFVENRGQWPAPVRYLAQMHGLNMWVTDREVVYDIYHDAPVPAGKGSQLAGARQRSGDIVRMQFLGAMPTSLASASEPLAGRFNYLRGSDQNKWVRDAASYSSVQITKLYPGVSTRLYFDHNLPRYDIIVAPGADPMLVNIGYAGAKGVRTNENGELVLTTSAGEITEQGLLAYQNVGGTLRKVDCRFVVNQSGVVRFTVGGYDRTQPLVIDPVINSTYLGGRLDETGNSIAVDASGNSYLTGVTASPDYPTAAGPYFASLRGNTDAYVSKLNADMSGLLYSTFIGGDNDDAANGITVDASGNAYIAGVTTSPNFPFTHGAYDSTYFGNGDAFVTKLNATGNNLVFSTLLGGSGYDVVNGIAVDATGNPYVTGRSTSTTFPTTSGAYQRTAAGGDAFVTKLNIFGTGLVYSTLLGGSGDDGGVAIVVRNGNAYVTGYTSSGANNGESFFPTTVNAPQSTFAGLTDAFLAELTTTASGVVFATMLGGNGTDIPHALAVDPLGNIYVTGATDSSGFPVTQGAYRIQFTNGEAFVAKYAPNGGGLIYATFLGGLNVECGTGIAADSAGVACVTGWTRSLNLITTPGSYQRQNAGGMDGFIIRLNPLGTALVYSSYLGGTGDDSLVAMALPSTNNLYLTGSTSSSDFPITGNAYQPGINNPVDLFVANFGILQVLSPNGGEIACAGSNYTIRWSGGTTSTYNLYFSANAGLTFTPIAFSVAGNSYVWPIPAGLAAANKYRIKVVSNGTETDSSDQNFTINSPPSVTTNPSNQTVGSGGTATFTALAKSTPNPTVQWQVSIDSGRTWQNIAGATSTTLTVSGATLAQSGYQYRAVFTNTCSAATSNAATLRVQALHLTAPNGGESFCTGSVADITWEPSNIPSVDLSYSSDGGTSWKFLAGGVSGASYKWAIPGVMPGSSYMIRATQTGGGSSDISDAPFTIYSKPAIIQQPLSITVVPGGTAIFAVESFPTSTVQWQISTNGGADFTDVPGATGVNLNVPNVQQADSGHLYRAVLTNECGSVTSNSAEVVVSSSGAVPVAPGFTNELSIEVLSNPLHGDGVIRLYAPSPGNGSVTISDVTGKVVQRINRWMVTGWQNIPLSASELANGSYIVSLSLNGGVRVTQVTVVK